MSTWASLIEWAIHYGVPRAEAEMLACDVAGQNRAWLLAHRDGTPPPHQEEQFRAMIRRRGRGEPLPYIIGNQQFYGLTFRVTPATLIPRPETELLVEQFLAIEPSLPLGPIADVGTGSGCILGAGIAYCGRFGIGTDISPDALEIAAENWRSIGLSDRTLPVVGDFLAPFAFTSLAAVLCNPPYVAPGDPRLDPAVALHEPAVALYSEGEGLEATRRVIAGAATTLVPNGRLFLEIGVGMANAVSALLTGWHDVTIHPDLAGIPRVAVARLR